MNVGYIMTPLELQIQSADTMKAKLLDDSVVVECMPKCLLGKWKWHGASGTVWNMEYYYYRIKPTEEKKSIFNKPVCKKCDHCEYELDGGNCIKCGLTSAEEFVKPKETSFTLNKECKYCGKVHLVLDHKKCKSKLSDSDIHDRVVKK